MARNKIGGVVLEGDKELERKLRALPKRVFKNVVRGATTKAMTPATKTAKRLAKGIGDRGTIAKSIGKKTKTYPRTQTIVTLVGPRRGFKDTESGHNPSNTAHLAEFGTAPHVIRSEKPMGPKGVFGLIVHHPGQKATPFMRPALDNNEAQILSIYRRALSDGIVRQAKKKA